MLCVERHLRAVLRYALGVGELVELVAWLGLGLGSGLGLGLGLGLRLGLGLGARVRARVRVAARGLAPQRVAEALCW